MEDNVTDVITTGQFRDVSLPPRDVSSFVRLDGFGGVSPSNRPPEVPEWLPDDWEPDWAELEKKTPKDRIRSVTNKAGAVLYRYVTTDFIIRKLNKVFKHSWGTEVLREGWAGEVHADGSKEYVTILQLVAPKMFRPIIGVGSSMFMPTNAQDTEAKTRAGAYTAALKNAAKQLGVGRDVEEDNPEVAKLVEDRTRTISAMYDRLVSKGHDVAAKNIFRRLAPAALLDDGTVMMSSVDFEALEPIQREMSNLTIRTAAKKVDEAEGAT